MSKILFVESDRRLAESVAEHIRDHLGVDSEIIDTLAAATDCFIQNKGDYLAVIINLALSTDNYAPFEKIPTIAVTGNLPTSSKKIVFASNVLDYVTDYTGYNLEYIIQLLKRGVFAKSAKMLIVDNEPVWLNLMRNLLSNKGYLVLEARNGEAARALLESDPDIRMMLIDGDICEKNNYDLIRGIRENRKKNQLSIIPFCRRGNDYQRITLLRSGASDCIEKPFKIEDFHVRIMNNLQLIEVLGELTELANRDFLTRLYNRRYFFEIGNKLYENFKRGALQLHLAMIDIDHLKHINDTYGHIAGDKVIKAVAEIIGKSLRASDVIARMGGEEFCVLCTDIKVDEVMSVFERLRESVAEKTILLDQGSIHYSISVGVTGNIGTSLEGMIHEADTLLYQAKKQGRNVVVVR